MVGIKKVIWLLLLLCFVISCNTQPTIQPNAPQPSPPQNNSDVSVLGHVELNLSSEPKTSRISPSISTQGLTAKDAVTFKVPAASVDTLTENGRQYRYLTATIEVTNHTQQPLSNLTLYAAASENAIGGTSINNMISASGATLNVANIAQSIRLVHAIDNRNGVAVINAKDADYQALLSDEVRALQTELSAKGIKMTALQEGFTARKDKSRTIPPGGTGTVVISVRFPYNGAKPAESPYSMTLTFAVGVMEKTRFTRGEFNDSSGAFEARVREFFQPNAVPADTQLMFVGKDKDTANIGQSIRVNAVQTFVGQDVEAPVLSINKPAVGRIYNDLTVTGNVEDNSSNPVTLQYTIEKLDYKGNVLTSINGLKTEDTINNGTGYFSTKLLVAEFPNKQGILRVKVIATDTAGNKSEEAVFEQLVGPRFRKDVIVQKVAASDTNSYAISQDGSLYGWGYDGFCILGSTTGDVLNPKKIYGFDHNPTSIAVLDRQAYAIVDGKLYAWGNVSGIGLQDNLCTPTLVPGAINRWPIRQILAKEGHVLALTAEGVVWSWGKNEHGQLGREGNPKIPAPVTIPHAVYKIGIGDYSSFALIKASDATGNKESIWAWGKNEQGMALGIEDTSTKISSPQQAKRWDKVADLVREDAIVSAGENHMLYVKHSTITNGDSAFFYGLGYSGYGELGQGSDPNDYRQQEPLYFRKNVLGNVDFIILEANRWKSFIGHSTIKKSNGDTEPARLFATGNNGSGQLGIGKTEQRFISTYTEVEALRGIDLAYFAAGKFHTIAMASNGDIYTWGSNSDGALGNGVRGTEVHTPQRISLGLKPNQRVLTLRVIDDSGKGYVYTDEPKEPQYNCNTNNSPCRIIYDVGQKIYLDAEPERNSNDSASWSGVCRNGGGCRFTLVDNMDITVKFAPNDQLPKLSQLRVLIAGEGRITSDPKGIDCKKENDQYAGNCEFFFAPDTEVILIPSSGTVTKWDGPTCTMIGNNCKLTVSGNYTQMQAVISNQAPSNYNLGVSVGANGRLDISGNGSCTNTTCNYTLPVNSNVSISAHPDAGYKVQWSGNCSGTAGNTCQLSMNSPKSVSATFIPENTAPTEYSLTIAITGKGSVQVSGGGNNYTCTNASCSYNFAADTTVNLSTRPDSGAEFSGWSGDCSGDSCSLTMTANRNVIAKFSQSGNSTPNDFTVTFVPDNHKCNAGFTATTCSYKPQDTFELIGVKLADAFPLAPIKVLNLQSGNVTLSFDVTTENGGDTSKITFNLDSELTPSKNIANFTVNAKEAPSGTYIVTIKATSDGVTKELVYKFSPNL